MTQQGFFSDSEMQDMFGTKLEVERDGPDCLACGMYKKVQSPRMKVTGQGKLKTLIVAQSPGEDEDLNWRKLGYKEPTQLIGKAGQFKRNALKKHGLDLDRDFWKINAVNCRPVTGSGKRLSNREPTPQEITCCRRMVDDAIKELKPKFIWLLGREAILSFYQDYFSKNPMARWRGLCIPDRESGAWILPMYHPSHLIRDSKNDNLHAIYNHDLDFAVKCLEMPYHHYTNEKEDERIYRIYEFDGVIKLLDKILEEEPEWLVHDYEGSGLKPYRPGHRVTSISLCYSDSLVGELKAYSFPYQYRDHFTPHEQRQIKSLWRKIMTHPKIGKVAHHKKFEHIWSRKFFGVVTAPWRWCTMMGARVQDNRQMWNSLEFQTYVNFGVLPYGKQIAKYLRGFPFNKIDDADLRDLLLYGGRDSMYTAMLFQKQYRHYQKDSGLCNAYQLFHEGEDEMGDIQWHGISVSEEYCHDEKKRIEEEESLPLMKKLLQSEEAKAFETKIGREILISSNQDLGILFYEVLGYHGKKNSKEHYSVDKFALEKIKIPFVEDLHKMKKWVDTSSYLDQWMREVYDGRMHPNFNLIVPASYRGSSSDPNFQNVPVRDMEAQKSTRQAIRPSKGRKILDWDYDGIEVCTAAYVSGCPGLIKYVTTPGTDMHRDTAMDIWKIPKDQVTKEIRFYAKNIWVFAEFYGSYYVTCARNLWDVVLIHLNLKTQDGTPLRNHLRSQGIKKFSQFESHCADVERIFWYERFDGYRKWKDKINKLYRKIGFIETGMGFKFSGYMTYNQACNYPIQGPAFHTLLWTLIETGKIAKEEKWETKRIGQIHDSGIEDLVPEEQDHVIKTIKYIGTEKIREVHPFITVPLSIEFNESEIDGNWFDMKGVK